MTSLGKTIIVVSILSMFTFAGCNEEQRAQVDKVAADVNSIADQGEAILNSPIGKFVPPDIKFIAAGVLNVAQLLAGAWLIRDRKTTNTIATAIIKGVEASPDKGKSVKPAIAAKMVSLGVEDAGRAYVEKVV